MKYVPCSTLDSYDVSKAKELYSSSKSDSMLITPYVCCIFVSMFFFIIGAAPLAIPFFVAGIILGIKNSKKKQPRDIHPDACREWMLYCEERYFDYYGMQPALQWRACYDAVRASLYGVPFPIDIWTNDKLILSHIDPANYIEYVDDACDYTYYLAELAYRFMVICHRANCGDARICNFVECVSYLFWGTGEKQLSEAFCLFSVKSTDSINPFIQYPILQKQQNELIAFDYRHTFVRNGFIWNAWNMATQRFERDKAKHSQVIRYHDSEEFAYNQIRRGKEIAHEFHTQAYFQARQMSIRNSFERALEK